MVEVVHQEKVALGIDRHAVRPLEIALPPRLDEIASLVQNNHRVVAAIEHIDAVTRIVHGSRCCILEVDPVRDLAPERYRFINGGGGSWS
jgi:hypothetical protein